MQITLIARTTKPAPRASAGSLYAALRELLGQGWRLPESGQCRLIERPAFAEGGTEFTRWTGSQMVLELPEDTTALLLDNEDSDREVARRLLRTVAITARDAAEGLDAPINLESVEINFSDHRELADASVVRFD